MNIEELGFTKEELTAKVVERICDRVMNVTVQDEDGNDYPDYSEFHSKLKTSVKARIDEVVQQFAEKEVLPNVAEYIEKVTLQTTNKWGEPASKPLTFKEYLVEAAEHYLTEKVNYEGKAKSEENYNWTGTQTRITHLVHAHLHYEIDTSMRQAVGSLHKQLTDGLQETVRLKLGEISKSLTLDVKTR